MRQLKLKIEDKEYILEYNRDSIKWLEAVGFDVEQLTQKPLTYREMLWQSLFVKNYGNVVNPTLAIKLMDTYTKEHGAKMTAKVVKFALDEYTAFFSALADTNSEKTEDEELEIIEQ